MDIIAEQAFEALERMKRVFNRNDYTCYSSEGFYTRANSDIECIAAYIYKYCPTEIQPPMTDNIRAQVEEAAKKALLALREAAQAEAEAAALVSIANAGWHYIQVLMTGGEAPDPEPLRSRVLEFAELVKAGGQ